MLHRLVAALCAGLIGAAPALACTDVRIIATDGTPLTVRTMEFGIDLDSDVVIAPRGRAVTSPAPDGAKGMTWTTKYGFVYANAFGLPIASDGLNEKGLGFGALYLPGETKYQDVAKGQAGKALSNALFGNWVLGNFATVGEVRAAVDNVVVWGQQVEALGSFIPLHFVVHDAAGDSAVIEYVDGQVHIYDNTVGVLTNSPAYDWHMVNLRNYVNLSAVNDAPVKIGGVTYAGTGQGSGLRGLPGDPTPPSRFIMAAAALHLSDKPKNTAEALTLAQHLINRVDIPKGMVRDYSSGAPGEGTPEKDYTQWTVFRDHANLTYTWRSYGNTELQAVDLKAVDFTAGQPERRLPIAGAKQTVRLIAPSDFPITSK